MSFNHTKRLLFVGTADSFSSQLGGSFNSLVPTLYCLECSGYELATLDKVEIPEVAASLGMFTVRCHASENIVFCTFTTKVLVTAFAENSFKKFRVIDGFSDSPVYQTVVASSILCGFCPKEESLSVLSFVGKEVPKGNTYQWNEIMEKEKSIPKSDDKQGPLLAKYSYSIPEFKNSVKFALVDTYLGIMFMFTSQEIYKCVISRKSLILEDKSVTIGMICSSDCYQAMLFEKSNRIVAFENCTNNLIVLNYSLEVVSKIEGISGPNFTKSMTHASMTQKPGSEMVAWLKGNHQAALIDINSMEEIDRAPLFGTVNTYSENIPLLVAFCDGNWCGYYFLNNEFYLSWIEKGKQKEGKLLQEVIPEAKSLHSMQFDDSGKNLVIIIGSTRETSQSELVLISIQFGFPFAMNDYYRLTDVLPNFSPSIVVSDGHWILNKGTSIQAFKVINGEFQMNLTISGISSGSLSLSRSTPIDFGV